MDESMPYLSYDLHSMERDSSRASLLDFLFKNEELVCSLSTADQFEGCEIFDLIKKLSNDGLIQLTPDVRDIETLSLSLTEKGLELACELANAEQSIIGPVPDYSHFSLMHPSSIMYFGHVLDDR